MPAGMSRNFVPFAKERQNYTLPRRWVQGVNVENHVEVLTATNQQLDSDTCVHSEEMYPPWRLGFLEMIVSGNNRQIVCHCRSGDYRIRKFQAVHFSRLYHDSGKVII